MALISSGPAISAQRSHHVAPPELCRRHRVTLRLYLEEGSSNGSSSFDDWHMWSEWNFFSVHGHNLDPSIVVTARSSTDNFVAVDTVEATPAVALASFYAALSTPVLRRYARVRFGGTNNAGGPPVVGEIVLGKSLTLAQPPDLAVDKRWVAPQVRGAIGTWSSYAAGLAATRRADFGSPSGETRWRSPSGSTGSS